MLNQFLLDRLNDIEDAVASAGDASLDQLEVRLLMVMGKIRARRESRYQVNESVACPTAFEAQRPTAG